MHKFSDLLGLPILEKITGAQIGEVQEIALDIDGAAIQGIIVVSANWLTSGQCVAFHDLFNIGRDAVMLEDRKAISDLTLLQKTVQLLYFVKDLYDKPIFTETGFNLGMLVDIIYDNLTGEIRYYQVSDGIFTDLVYGRMIMPVPQVQVVGQDKLIVPDSSAKLLQVEE